MFSVAQSKQIYKIKIHKNKNKNYLPNFKLKKLNNLKMILETRLKNLIDEIFIQVNNGIIQSIFR